MRGTARVLIGCLPLRDGFELERFLSCCIRSTRRGERSISLPRRAILRRTTRTAKCFDTVSAKPNDRLRCTVGLSKTAWRIGSPEEQRSRSFASHPEHGKGTEPSCSAQDGAFMRIEIGNSGYSNPGTALVERRNLLRSLTLGRLRFVAFFGCSCCLLRGGSFGGLGVQNPRLLVGIRDAMDNRDG